MRRTELGQTIGVLANFGVIAGIVFLAIEINQNNALLASEANVELFRNRVSADERLGTAFIKGLDGQELTREERFILEQLAP